VQNLQTQIEVLELENSYLRGGTSSNDTPSHPRSILKEPETAMSTLRNEASAFSPPSTQSHRQPYKVQFAENGADNSLALSQFMGRQHSAAYRHIGSVHNGNQQKSFQYESLLLKLDQSQQVCGWKLGWCWGNA